MSKYSFLCLDLRSYAIFVILRLFVTLVATTEDEYTGIFTFNVNDLDVYDTYFEILYPEELRYTYKIHLANNFGIIFNETYAKIGLIPVQPIIGCESPSNGDEIRGNIALVQRGICTFLSKAYHAEKAGAVAVVIMDSDSENDAHYVDMIGDDSYRQVSIPAAFLLGKNGHMIWETLKRKHLTRALINIPVNVTKIPLHEQRQPPWIIW